MPTRKKRDQSFVYNPALAKNYLGNRLSGLDDVLAKLINRVDKLRVAGFGYFRYGACHDGFPDFPLPVAWMKKYPSVPASDDKNGGRDAKRDIKAQQSASLQNRTLCADVDMRIDRDAMWYYHGSPIRRKELVCLFASALTRNEDGEYWLITPREMCLVEVEDVPFLAVELFTAGTGDQQVLSLRSNVDEIVSVDSDHPIYVVTDSVTGEPLPYFVLGEGLEARITRSVYYELVSLGDEHRLKGEDFFGVWSSGSFFPLGKLDEGS